MLALLLAGCASLDTAIHNPVHCSAVSEETCEEEVYWDRMCVPCGEDYDWGASYDWMEGTLEEGQVVRPIPADSVARINAPTGDGEGELDGYFIAAHGENAANAQITLLYNHGSYGGVEHFIARLQLLYEGGYNLIIWDYRGYGKSEPPAPPSAAQWMDDARLFREIAAENAPDPDRIAIYGLSLGAIPAVEQAVAEPGCALALEAPFTSVEAITTSNVGLSLPGSFLTEGRYENIEKIKGYDGPLLAMIGTEDEQFAVADVRALAENAGGGDAQLEVLDGVSHGIIGGGIPEDLGLTSYLALLGGFLAGTPCAAAP